MSNILEEILRTKRREVDAAARQDSIAALQARIVDLPPTRDFVGALRAKHAVGKAAVIAEIKKKSPSAGQFRRDGDFDPARFAASYEAHGAACLSVLTDQDYFGGSAADLVAARAACQIPVLRKDFIVDAYQVYEARAMGADAVLFIMDALPISEFLRLEDIATDLGLDVLAESHTAAQLQQALLLRTPLIGINNRDLTRFKTDLETTTNLAPLVPQTRILITESGVETRQAVDSMRKNNINTFLVGGALLREEDPGAAFESLFPN
jgi:indole-3-glycerol phosphate synthase